VAREEEKPVLRQLGLQKLDELKANAGSTNAGELPDREEE
jgi:hypothetical protein